MTRQNWVKIPIKPTDYESKLGRIANHKTISEYSVIMYHSPTEEREIRNDLTNVRYLIDDDVRDSLLPFDLKLGLKTFQDKQIEGETLRKEPCLQTLCNWAIKQPGSTINEVFDGADFVTWRGTLKRIAATIHKKDTWRFVAVSLGGVIFISEQAREYHGGRHHLPTYSGFKFEQYITTNRDGDLDSDEPVDNRSTFELKTGRDVKNFGKLETVLQSEIVGVKSLIMGIKGENYMVERVEETSIDQIKAKNGQIARKTSQSYAFLADFLSRLKAFLGDHEACESYFDSKKMEVVIKRISLEEANRNGKGVTAEFMKYFNQ
ncbi:hypothetical protein PRIPAC_73304 [Pristionchus pacificus]|uniref:Decapping nuclease n=1 Tax=Pristionchus pacificus TaxID=54126 RepID=A0A2A6BG48_PRIPA|nr:hypothetical protein PRIPAC_73304 [Pristionchus pacificus]|eukprot:PDM64781.1 hypothetical protein PRIPAC_53037 [Pristionchus pacificus]